MRSRIFFKLLLAAVALIALATVTLDAAIRRAWERSLRAEIEQALTQKTRLVAQRVRDVANPQLAALTAEAARAAEARVTVIRSDGTVLSDTEAPPATMENHASRPEFRAALQGKTGSATRTSHTLGIEFLYVAVPLKGGALRLAYPLSAVQHTTAQVRDTLLWASLLALALATVVAALIAQSIAQRLRRIMAFADRVAAGDLSARIQESSGDEIGQLAAALDRTARRLQADFAAVEESRRQLEALLNSMQEGVAAISRDSKLVWANGALRRLLPVREGAPLVDTMRDPSVIAAVHESLQTQTTRKTLARAVVPGRVFEITTAPMPGVGVVAVLHDISEIERVEKTRRDFIANVSHELRTPLTSIVGYTETLLDAPPAAGGREFLQVIHNNAARMTRLTEDLLTLARVESGELKLALEPLAPAEAVREAVAAYRARAQAAGVALEISLADTPEIRADRDAVQQVLANLIDNALRYAADGGRVVVGATGAGPAVEFYVRDFGPGIASEHLPRLFERFYRVDRDRSRESGGTGLGLAIVKHIVLNHGGTVRAESALGHGTTFYFTLPAAPVAADVAPGG